MKTLNAITLGLLLIVASGCASKKIGSTYDPLAIFPAQATWNWDPSEIQIPSDERLGQLNINAIVRDSIAEGFAERGYTEAPAGTKARYLLSYEVGIGRRISETKAEGFGSLSVSLNEADSKRRVWLGFVKVDIDTSRTEAERRDVLRKDLAEMLKDFPPSQPK
jgi:hypothetical protein